MVSYFIFLKKHLIDCCLSLIVFLFYPVVWCLTYKVSFETLKKPLIYGEDSTLTLAFIKGVFLDWNLENKYLGAPFSQLNYYFPTPEGFYVVLIKFLGFIFSYNHIYVLNAFILLSYSMTGLSSYLVLRKLKITHFASLIGSFSFAFLAFHQLRLNHTFLANYFSMPIFVYLAYKCYSDSTKWVKKDFFKLFLLVFVIASAGSYYAIFGILIILSAGIIGFFQSNKEALKKSIILSVFVSGTIIVNVAPNLIWQLNHEKNHMVGQRQFIESEMYGLKIAQLILPVSGHRIKLLSQVTDAYSANAPYINENISSSLGFFASFGFFILIFLLFKSTIIDNRLALVTKLNVISLLYATIGGFGVLVALFITPQFRGLNRISILIAFFAIIASCIFIDDLISKLKSHFYRNCAYLTILPISIFFIYKDQVSPFHAPSSIHGFEVYDQNEVYFKKIESMVSKNSMIYQMPYLPYPESAPKYKEGYLALLLPYIHSDYLRWSYGTMKGTSQDSWQFAVSNLDINQIINVLKNENFAGILIDRDGYEDHAVKIEKIISSLSAIPPIVNSNGRYSFYLLDSVQVPQKENIMASFVVYHSQWFNEETSGLDKWRWSGEQKSVVEIRAIANELANCKVQFRLESRQANIINVSIPGFFNQDYDFHKKGNYEITLDSVPLKNGKSELIVTSSEKPIRLGVDSRKLSYRIINLNVCQ